MLLVAVDTSGRKGSIALCRGDADGFEVLQTMLLEGGTYSARLMPAIAELLELHGVAKHQIDAFVVVSGPGSFTGLRVGLATVKALAEVLRKPLVAVSRLEAVALCRGPARGQLMVAIDAGRGEVYLGEFRPRVGHKELVRDVIVKLEIFAASHPGSADTLLTPDAKVADALHSHGVTLVEAVQAGEIGAIGLRKLLAGEVADPERLDANYIRRSDAELFSAP